MVENRTSRSSDDSLESGTSRPPSDDDISPQEFVGATGNRGPGRPSAQILQGVVAREPEALDEFFECYFDHIYALAARLMGDPTQAQDVLQEVFFKVHRAAHRLDPERDPRYWLTAITYNTCREFWRSGAHKMQQRSVSLGEQPDLEQRLRSESPNPEEVWVKSERERAVQEAIDALPEPLRVAVLLHDYEGMGHEEIATVTGITHSAARKRYSRALSELAHKLGSILG